MIISTPEITKFNLNENVNDFIVMGSDVIYDKLDNEDIVQNIWSTLDDSDTLTSYS